MLHHIEKAGQETAVCEMIRVLKPGGKLIIVEITYTKQTVESLQGCGLTAVEFVPLSLPFYKQVVAVK